MRRLRLVSVLLLVCAMGFGVSLPCSAKASAARAAGGYGGHPEIRKALAALNLAANDLENAADDFCGHRVDALNAVNAAITQLGLAIECADGGSSVSSAELSRALTELRAQVSSSASAAKHPYIRKAIAACQLAANALEDAAHDYCGHRADALNATINAITELELALACNP
jgi:hypothetical protein